MVDGRNDSGLQVNAEIALKYVIAKNEGIPLDQVESHVEKALIKANEEGLIKYEAKSKGGS